MSGFHGRRYEGFDDPNRFLPSDGPAWAEGLRCEACRCLVKNCTCSRCNECDLLDDDCECECDSCGLTLKQCECPCEFCLCERDECECDNEGLCECGCLPHECECD